MADEQDVHPEKIRKTISLTHKQAGVSAGIVGVLISLQPFLKSMIHDETKVSDARLAAVELAVESLAKSNDKTLAELKADNVATKEEIIHRMERGWDKFGDRLKDVEGRITKVTDHQQKQIDELFAVKLKLRNSF